MNDQQFIQTVAPRIGVKNAIGNLNPIQQGALIELLIEKGIIARAELDEKTSKGFARFANAITKMPVPSPFQPK